MAISNAVLPPSANHRQRRHRDAGSGATTD
jgi:hypothetical protein